MARRFYPTSSLSLIRHTTRPFSMDILVGRYHAVGGQRPRAPKTKLLHIVPRTGWVATRLLLKKLLVSARIK